MKRHILQFLKILIYTKGVKGVSSRIQKIRLILKVSLGKTLYTIPQNPICIKICGNDFKGKDVSLQCMKIVENVSSRDTFSINPIFFKIMEGVFSRDTFNIIPFFGNREMCLLIPSTILKILGLY